MHTSELTVKIILALILHTMLVSCETSREELLLSDLSMDRRTVMIFEAKFGLKEISDPSVRNEIRVWIMHMNEKPDAYGFQIVYDEPRKVYFLNSGMSGKKIVEAKSVSNDLWKDLEKIDLFTLQDESLIPIEERINMSSGIWITIDSKQNGNVILRGYNNPSLGKHQIHERVNCSIRLLNRLLRSESSSGNP